MDIEEFIVDWNHDVGSMLDGSEQTDTDFDLINTSEPAQSPNL
jgi:hypothetical protein